MGGTNEESQLHHGSESPSQEILTKFIQPIPGSRLEHPSPLGTASSVCPPKYLCGTARKNNLSFMTTAKVLPLEQSPQMCQLRSEQPRDSEGQGTGQGLLDLPEHRLLWAAHWRHHPHPAKGPHSKPGSCSSPFSQALPPCGQCQVQPLGIVTRETAPPPDCTTLAPLSHPPCEQQKELVKPSVCTCSSLRTPFRGPPRLQEES